VFVSLLSLIVLKRGTIQLRGLPLCAVESKD